MKKLFVAAILVVSSVAAFAVAKEGVGFGYKDDIKVSVEVEGDKITAIKVLEMKETKRIAEPAIEKLTAAIIEKQMAIPIARRARPAHRTFPRQAARTDSQLCHRPGQGERHL